MADKNNISITSKPGYGFNLTRTTFDTHQEISAKVIGVLKYNNDIRDRLLKRNIGSYEMVEKPNGIGYISNLYSLETSKPLSLGEEGLLGYTHVLKSSYQEKINQRYGIGDFISYYRTGSLPETNNWKWKGLYEDYTKYIDETFGLHYTSLNLLSDLFKVDKIGSAFNTDYNRDKSLTIQSILNDFLQYDNIKYAMEQTRIGTVRPNPLAALAGSVTTNINNFSGTDTSLGLISNQLYAHALRNGAQFNTLRRTPYITLGVYDTIGNKLSTIATLDSDNRIDPDTGRLAFEFGNGVGVRGYESLALDTFQSIDMIDATRDIADSRNARYNNIISNIDRYMPFYGHQYSSDINFQTLKGYVPNVLHSKGYRTWNEGDKGNKIDDVYASNFNNIYLSLDDTQTFKENNTGLIKKTQELFTSHDETGIDTLIGRFHTSGGRDATHNEASLLQTAVSHYGMSHGRNLLNKRAYEMRYADKINGYENPYCRVWTYHHQYNKINNLIRPFSSEVDIEKLQSNWWMYGRRFGSSTRLNDNTVLNKNGLVNIAPSSKNSDKSIDIKKCMFSIENLAWKNQSVTKSNYLNAPPDDRARHYGPLSPEQRGPNGGRIMWFPPYDLKFNEQVGVNWNPIEFIGRGEKIYTYTNTERTGTLSFTLLVDHPSILDMWKDSKGKSLNDEDAEQELLRFFAGCNTLELDNVKVPLTDTVEEEIPSEPSNITHEVPQITTDIIFYVFFPNNYSGIDDYTDVAQYSDAHIDNVIKYLTTQYEVKEGEGSSNGAIYTDKKWEYRIDKAYMDQNLKSEENYKDKASFGLNANISAVTSNEEFKDATESFVYMVNNLHSKIKETGQIVKEIVIQGYASSHGNKNDVLPMNRTKVLKKWILKKINEERQLISEDKISLRDGGIITVGEEHKNNVSSKEAKKARCAKVTIKIDIRKPIEPLTNVGTAILTNAPSIESNEIEVSGIRVNSVQTPTKAQKRALRRAERQLKRQAKKSLREHIKNGPDETILEERKRMMMSDMHSDTPSIMIPHIREFDKILSSTQMENNRSDVLAKIKQKRWDEEAQYFEMLESNDSFTYTRLINKVKYFTPAFHSITPEGFNARLAFLHQCTRQGSTLSASDNWSTRSAGNMAFGRPPICVLRIGDFFHTKILINSISIDYEDVHWDMNPEGIGMQPMLAKISMNITYLGGSSLEAPISRLQNAVSFNYYANQEVYDDRADIGIYENGQAVIQNTPWLPNIQLFTESRTVTEDLDGGTWSSTEGYESLRGKKLEE